MKEFFFTLISFLLFTFQISCTRTEGFSNGRGFSGHTEPPATSDKTASFINSKSKCTILSENSRFTLSCHVVVIEDDGTENIANKVLPGVQFSWSLSTLSASFDLSNVGACNTTNDGLNYQCSLNSMPATNSVNVSLQINDTNTGDVKTVTQPVETTVVVASPSPPPVVSDSHSSNNVLLLKMTGQTGDLISDTKGNPIINTGVNILSDSGKYGSGSAIFSGTDFLEVPYNSDFNFGSGDFTVEMYVKFSQINVYNRIMGRWTGPVAGWLLAQELGIWSFYWKTGIAGTGQSGILYEPPVPTAINQWYHIAVSRNGSTIRMYLDGVLVATETINDPITDSTEPLFVGGYTRAPEFSGSMNFIRITKGVGRYTGNFPLPTPSQF